VTSDCWICFIQPISPAQGRKDDINSLPPSFPPPPLLLSPTTQVSEVKKTGDTLTLSVIPHTDEGKPQEISNVNCLLFAVGRDANLVDLGIDVTGVQLDQRGFIQVDEYQNSSVKGIYALGDVAGKKLLTPGENVRRERIWNLSDIPILDSIYLPMQ